MIPCLPGQTHTEQVNQLMGINQPQFDRNQYEPVGDYVSIFQRNGIWYANYMEHGKQVRRSVKTTRKKPVLSYARKIETLLQEGQGVLPKNVSAHELIQGNL